MKKLLYILTFLIPLLISTNSCNDDFDINVPDPDDLIVIDGWIENGQFAKVLVTRNSPYFSSIDSISIRSLVLTFAKVTLSDGERSEILILRRNNDYFPPYIFEGNEIIGDTGKTYSIKVEYGGKTATAHTIIPPKVPLDTAYFKLETNSDSLGKIYVEFYDPPELKNFYRVLTKTLGKDIRYTSSIAIGIDDNLFNGEKFGFSLSNGPGSFMTTSENEYFRLGDTVSLKFCTIDKPHYDFWMSLQEEIMNASNPFASSLSIVKSNVEGDGLGIWGGYGVYYYTLVMK